jgi:hypothetical protein
MSVAAKYGIMKPHIQEFPMPDSDIALAKKQLAGDLMMLVIVQAVTLSPSAQWFTVEAFLFFGIQIRGLGWMGDMALIMTFGLLIASVAACWGCYKLYSSQVVPFWIRVYGNGIFLFIPLFLIMFNISFLRIYFFYWFVLLFHSYGLIPQFFISRWLAKVAES